MTKAMVMLTYGRIGYYMTPENPYYTAITDLLFELTKNENELVAEPAIYGLCNFALAHEELVRIQLRLLSHIRLFLMNEFLSLVSSR